MQKEKHLFYETVVKEGPYGEYTAKKIYYGRIVALVLILFLFLGSWTIITEGHVGVKYRLGQIVETGLDAGVHFHIPFIESVSRVDITEQTEVLDVSAYTKDTQTVESIDLQVNYYYDKTELDTLVRQIGLKNIQPKLITPNLTSIIKNEVGKYKAEELIANRSSLESNVQHSLDTLLKPYGIIISRVSIQDIEFKASFEQIVEEKVAAEQQALKVQNETVKKEEEARQAVIQAQAEAEATKLKADAEAYSIKVIQEQIDRSPEYIELKKIEKWNGKFPEVMGNTVNPFITLGD